MIDAQQPLQPTESLSPTRLQFGEGDPLVSVITVFNRADTLERCLLSSLRRQRGVPFEWLGIDNAAGAFDGAAAALNAAAAHARGDTLLFVHQDVILHGDQWIRTLHDDLAQLPDVGIAGVVGRRARDGRFVGFIRDRKAITGAPLGEPAEVQTLDECVLAMPRRVYEQHPFDEASGGWHVYGVDACLRVRRAGLRVYVLPLFVHHDSRSANLDGLAAAHAWIRRRHGAAELPIHTTCGTIGSGGVQRAAALRSRLAAAFGRAAAAAGIELRTGHHADLTALEERYDDILVVHFANDAQPSVPVAAEAEALSPESATTRHVRHRVLRRGEDPAVLPHSGAQLIILSNPGDASAERLDEVRSLLHGSSADILAIPHRDEQDATAALLRCGGWTVEVRGGRRHRPGSLVLQLRP